MGLNCHLIDILNTVRFSRKQANPPDACQNTVRPDGQ